MTGDTFVISLPAGQPGAEDGMGEKREPYAFLDPVTVELDLGPDFGKLTFSDIDDEDYCRIIDENADLIRTIHQHASEIAKVQRYADAITAKVAAGGEPSEEELKIIEGLDPAFYQTLMIRIAGMEAALIHACLDAEHKKVITRDRMKKLLELMQAANPAETAKFMAEVRTLFYQAIPSIEKN